MSFNRTFDELYQSLLSDAKHEGTPVKRNQLVLLKIPYCFSTDGTFLIPQLIAFHLNNIPNHKVVLVSFLNNFDHYNAISAKLGINLTSALNENKFTFLHCLPQHKSAFHSTNLLVCPVIDQANKCTLDKLTICLNDLIDTHCTSNPDIPLAIMIDDISAPVMIGVSCIEALDFIFSICAKLGGKLTAASSVCVLVASDEERKSAEYRLTQHLSFESDITLTVEGLASGFSKEVHGKLTARVRKSSPAIAPYQEECHFKLEDRGVKLFAIGTATGVL